VLIKLYYNAKLKKRILKMTNPTIIPVKMYGPVYKAIYKCEFLLPIAATSAVGLTTLGPIGLAAGALGAVDVIAKHYEVYEKPYLTSAMLGWGSLSSFKTSYYLSDIIGITAGLLFPTGIIYPHIDKIVAPVSGAISGYSYMGPYGAAAGFAAGAIDEGLSLYNITHSYTLSTTLSNIATANLFLPQSGRVVNYILPEGLGVIKSTALELSKLVSKPGVKESIAIAISAISLSSEEVEEKTKSPALQLSEDLYELYGEIIPKAQLNDLIEKQAIALITSQIILAKLGLTFTKHYQNTEEGFTNLVGTDESWIKFIDSLSVISKFLIPYVGNRITTNYINGYFQSKFEHIMNNQLNDELLTGEVSLHLKQERTENAVLDSKEILPSKVLVEKMSGDIGSIAYNSLLPDAVSTVITGGYAIGHLYSINALDTVLYSSLYNQLTNEITHAISEQYYSYTNKLDELSSKIKSKYDHVKVNAASMSIYGANDFNKAGREELVDQIRELGAEQGLWGLAMSVWSTAQGTINAIFNWIVLANQIYQGDLARDKRSEVFSMTQDFSYMVSWDADNAGPMTTLKQSMDRIIELKARMAEVKNPLEHQPFYHYEKGEQTGICLNDLKVGKGNESRLYIKDLCVFDKHVAVTSASGTGKSTFFKAIKQIMHDGVWSEGNITYLTKNGNVPSIAMTSQDAYIPPEDSLLELITFKKGAAAEPYRAKVIELLTKIKIDLTKEGEISLIDCLDIKKDWMTGTSGGQKQKIDAVRLMLSEDKPDIIIFDEIFAGLDHGSIHDLQMMLDNEFPDSQIFVIDHEAKSHNTEEWYNNNLHLSDGGAQLLGTTAA
jgi:ABC-type uncharacterized transport system fused permease/ATPase subunit